MLTTVSKLTHALCPQQELLKSTSTRTESRAASMSSTTNKIHLTSKRI